MGRCGCETGCGCERPDPVVQLERLFKVRDALKVLTDLDYRASNRLKYDEGFRGELGLVESRIKDLTERDLDYFSSNSGI